MKFEKRGFRGLGEGHLWPPGQKILSSHSRVRQPCNVLPLALRGGITDHSATVTEPLGPHRPHAL
jgi:hypothetical protein